MSINKDEFVSFLEDFLLEEEAKELEVKITGEEEQDAPMINSMQKANYFLKLVKAIDEDIAAIDELCNEEIKKTTERITRYKEDQIAPMLRQRDYFVKLLRNFTEHELQDSKKRNIKLPNGTLSITKQQPLWTYEDEAIINFLTANHGENFVSTKIEEKIDKVAFKKAITINKQGIPTFNGLEVPGLTVTEREDKFTVK